MRKAVSGYWDITIKKLFRYVKKGDTETFYKKETKTSKDIDNETKIMKSVNKIRDVFWQMKTFKNLHYNGFHVPEGVYSKEYINNITNMGLY